MHHAYTTQFFGMRLKIKHKEILLNLMTRMLFGVRVRSLIPDLLQITEPHEVCANNVYKVQYAFYHYYILLYLIFCTVAAWLFEINNLQ